MQASKLSQLGYAEIKNYPVREAHGEALLLNGETSRVQIPVAVIPLTLWHM